MSNKKDVTKNDTKDEVIENEEEKILNNAVQSNEPDAVIQVAPKKKKKKKAEKEKNDKSEEEDLKNIPEDLMKESQKDDKNKSIGVDEYVTKGKMDIYKQIFELYCKNSQGEIPLKKMFAKLLLILIIIQAVILDVIFILRGANVLKFEDTTFNIFISAGVAELFALITIIIKNLFSDNLVKLLNKIIESIEK